MAGLPLRRAWVFVLSRGESVGAPINGPPLSTSTPSRRSVMLFLSEPWLNMVAQVPSVDRLPPREVSVPWQLAPLAPAEMRVFVSLTVAPPTLMPPPDGALLLAIVTLVRVDDVLLMFAPPTLTPALLPLIVTLVRWYVALLPR